MFFSVHRIDRIGISLELLGLESGVNINASTRLEIKSLMTEYLLSFLREGFHLNK